MRVGIVGLGNLGAAVANLSAGNGHDVIGWEYNADVVDEINQQHTNARFLPGVAIQPKVTATGELSAVFQNTAVAFIAIPSVLKARHALCVNYLCKRLTEALSPDDLHLLQGAAGRELDTGFFVYEAVQQIIRS